MPQLPTPNHSDRLNSRPRSEVHIKLAMRADQRGNKNDILERSEWIAFKTGETPAKEEL